MTISRIVCPLTVLVLVGLSTVSAQAQMFGPSQRTFGQPLSRQPGFSRFGGGQGVAAVADSAGKLEGNERFLRKNRRPTDFVGPDSVEMSRFIGNVQANARRQVRPAAEDLREPTDRSTTINRARAPAPPGTLYDPKITLSFTAHINPSEVAQRVVGVLAECPRLSNASRIEVSVEGRTAILRGVVLAESDHDLATYLVAFEPGISKVQNDLRVDPKLSDSLTTIADPTPTGGTEKPAPRTSANSQSNWDARPGEGGQKWLTLSRATNPPLHQSWDTGSRSRSY